MKIVLAILVAINLHADIKQEMLDLYQKREFKEACDIGYKSFGLYSKDEEYVSLYAFSCLNVDYVDRLLVPITILKFSKEARSNAAYFSVIVMQKKLLYHALIDDYDISALNLPTTDYILSKVFDLYSKHSKEGKKDFYIFEDEKDNRLKYKLYLIKDDKIEKMVIEEFYDSMSTKKHIYW